MDRWRSKIEKLRERGAKPKAIHDALCLGDPDYDGSVSAIERICQRLYREEGPKAIDVA